ncbi:MAG: hypothetical protein IKA37_07520 [Spirochaetales bacterium]|nr:hypothetical protein [Spirochaetales bacterium]
MERLLKWLKLFQSPFFIPLLSFSIYGTHRYIRSVFPAEILCSTIWLADTVSMEHANEIFSNGKYHTNALLRTHCVLIATFVRYLLT